MRPVYETELDRKKELAVAQTFADRFNYDIYRLPKFYEMDFAAYQNGQLVKWVEVKIRNCKSTDYNTYMLDFGKLRSAISIQNASQRSVVLVVQWTDTMKYWTFRVGYPILPGGRTDRGDLDDVVPCIYIPIHQFVDV